jgi:asparagine synthetase B (glutamine-hydrolysing)
VFQQAKTEVPTACLVSSGIDSNIIKQLIPKTEPIYFVCAVSDDLAFNKNDINKDEDTILLPIKGESEFQDFREWILAYGTVPAHNNYFALCILYREISADSSLNKPRRIKVALTGEGADEYFGGYGRYKELKKYLAGRDSIWINTLKSLSDQWVFLMNTRLHHSSLCWLKENGVNIDSVVKSHVSDTSCNLNENISLKLMSQYDIQTNLRYGLHKQDISGMLSSIEVRVPMVTQQLHNKAYDGSMANATPILSKLRLQTIAKRLGIEQPKKIGFPVSLDPFIPATYQPTNNLKEILPFARNNVLPAEIRTSLFMVDMLA